VATELGVDLSTMAGHGPGSFIRVPDIRAAGLPRPSATRQRGGPGMAELVARSKREIPHYHVSRTIDLTVTLEWLRRRPSGGITVAALLVRATALAAVVVPELNGYWTNGRFRPGDGVHVGIAIALPGGGLGTPTIADVPGLDPVDLARRLREVVERARSGGAWAAACVPATITVTDLAADGVDSVHTIIHPPQVAHAGFGGITWRPGAAGARLGIRPQLTATLAADQRTGPPKLGARFLSAIDMLLQRPAELTR
jgi:pyruvate dehydrogenase E2 component (dihydrolipoamide acetyltransferase)